MIFSLSAYYKYAAALGILLLSACATQQQRFTNQQRNQERTQQQQITAPDLTGAWQLVEENEQLGHKTVKLMADGYFSVAYYNTTDNRFIGTYGGTYTISNGTLTETYEFHTLDSTLVGTSNQLRQMLQGDDLYLAGERMGSRAEENWRKLPTNTQSPLTGAWQITGRADKEGNMTQRSPGPRKTVKMLSGNRFQWIAFNTETKQFSGTGGGTYTAEDGRYTENIEFFSRDPNRVGASLTFEYEVKDGNWHHRGLSSTGTPIYEIWSRGQQ